MNKIPKLIIDDIYESHKKVTRIKMSRSEYNVYRGWKLPSDECGDDEGYLVESIDGSKPNDERHEGYISWTPKKQFDDGYTLVTEEYESTPLSRMIKERNELDEKISKLSDILSKDRPEFISVIHFEYMKYQLNCMREYRAALNLRIKDMG